MKKKNRSAAGRFCILAGILLIAAGAALLTSWQWTIHSWAGKTEAYAETILAAIPEPEGAVPEERSDNTMAVLSLEGEDFAGVVEIPSFDSVLPVGDAWGKISRYPCRFSGSVYDGSLQIGGTTQKGQYDFYRQLSVGDSVFFTDMEGNRYAYQITDLRYTRHADQEALHRNDADLTLFIKNIYAFEYLIVFCDVME